MAFSKSVQFRGIKNVLKAYSNKAVPAWGLFQGTQFLEKYEGADIEEGATLLRDYLEALDQRSNDQNTYTLCVYEIPAGQKINSATKFDASFNFRLLDTIEDHLQNRIAGGLETRIAGIEDKLNQVLAPDEPEELTPQQKIWDTVGKILEHPQVQEMLARKLIGVVDGVSTTVGNIFRPPGLPAAIGTTATAQRVPADAAEENQKLQEAVNILVTVDPQLGTNLLKLAGIAKQDPDKYKLLVSMLKTF
jgi:hypothetical protein